MTMPVKMICRWITVLLMAVVPAMATTYYVDPNGNDANPCSVSQPCETIAKGLDLAQAGDTVFLNAGIYRQNTATVRAGTASQPITIQGSASAIVRGVPGGIVDPQPYTIFTLNHPYHRLQGFTIAGRQCGYPDPNSSCGPLPHPDYIYRKRLVEMNGSHGSILTNLSMLQAGQACVYLNGSNDVEIASSSIDSCGHWGNSEGEGLLVVSSDDLNAHDTYSFGATWGIDVEDGSDSAQFGAMTIGGIVGGILVEGDFASITDSTVGPSGGHGITLSGLANDVVQNDIIDNSGAGICFNSIPQGDVCGNVMAANNPDSGCTYGYLFNPTQSCGGGGSGCGDCSRCICEQ